ncbi:conjugative transposon protein TraN [Chryseobacterium sp. OSA05B]|uniref:conjugative transposon protein TraN n=1 Tax=Chryseobacterium sp. OSA05B TaxID=2862650 RepID=UPI001CC0515B|nr:conjugative transposon protein TraN [Chryseobacterium sp. OSA05B]
MKFILNKWLVSVLIIFCLYKINAQESTGLSSLDHGRLEPYKMEVTYNKTTHLLFPSPIRYVDLGSNYLIASKADEIGNVLRIKSSVRDFDEETNFSVITQDGKFYTFDVLYSSYPQTLNYDLVKLQGITENGYSSDILFEELLGSSSSLTEDMLRTLYKNNKRTIKHISTKSFKIQFLLNSLYVDDGKFYFVIQVNNRSNVNYNVDFINFKIADKKRLKRTIVQDKVLIPLRTYKPINVVNYKIEAKAIYLLDQFTLLNGQVLEIEIFERNGGRHQKITIKNTDLIRAKIIQGTDLKMK